MSIIHLKMSTKKL